MPIEEAVDRLLYRQAIATLRCYVEGVLRTEVEANLGSIVVICFPTHTGEAIQFVTRAERAFEITLDFVKERKAFGKPVGTFQNARFKMAKMRTQLDAAQALVDHCVLEHLEDKLSAELAAEAKLYTSEVEGRVVDECLQLHRGAGYMDEHEISRLYRDARVCRIYAGTSEIMKEIIGRGLGLDERQGN